MIHNDGHQKTTKNQTRKAEHEYSQRQTNPRRNNIPRKKQHRIQQTRTRKHTTPKKRKGDKMKMRKRMRIGEYESVTKRKGINEPFIKIKGNLYYRVQLDRDTQLDVEDQNTAIIISQLIKIERLLKKKR